MNDTFARVDRSDSQEPPKRAPGHKQKIGTITIPINGEEKTLDIFWHGTDLSKYKEHQNISDIQKLFTTLIQKMEAEHRSYKTTKVNITYRPNAKNRQFKLLDAEYHSKENATEDLKQTPETIKRQTQLPTDKPMNQQPTFVVIDKLTQKILMQPKEPAQNQQAEPAAAPEAAASLEEAKKPAPRIKVTGKVTESKTKPKTSINPLWLQFENIDTETDLTNFLDKLENASNDELTAFLDSFNTLQLQDDLSLKKLRFDHESSTAQKIVSTTQTITENQKNSPNSLKFSVLLKSLITRIESEKNGYDFFTHNIQLGESREPNPATQPEHPCFFKKNEDLWVRITNLAEIEQYKNIVDQQKLTPGNVLLNDNNVIFFKYSIGFDNDIVHYRSGSKGIRVKLNDHPEILDTNISDIVATLLNQNVKFTDIQKMLECMHQTMAGHISLFLNNLIQNTEITDPTNNPIQIASAQQQQYTIQVTTKKTLILTLEQTFNYRDTDTGHIINQNVASITWDITEDTYKTEIKSPESSEA